MLLALLMLGVIIGFYLLCLVVVRFSENVITTPKSNVATSPHPTPRSGRH